MKQVIICLGLLFLIFQNKSVNAQTGSLSVSPSVAEIIIGLDKDPTTTLTFSNSSSQAVHLTLSSMDLEQKSGSGNVKLFESLSGTNPHALAEYLIISSNEISIPPKNSVSVQVGVASVDNTTLGGYYGAVIARQKHSGDNRNQEIQPGLSALILVRKVSNQSIQLSLNDLELPSKIIFQMPDEIYTRFTNKGNVHIAPHGKIAFKDVWGIERFRGFINENSSLILPGVYRDFSTKIEAIKPNMPVMQYRMTVLGLQDTPGAKFYKEHTFYYVSPIILSTVLILLVLLIGYIIFRKPKNIEV